MSLGFFYLQKRCVSRSEQHVQLAGDWWSPIHWDPAAFFPEISPGQPPYWSSTGPLDEPTYRYRHVYNQYQKGRKTLEKKKGIGKRWRWRWIEYLGWDRGGGKVGRGANLLPRKALLSSSLSSSTPSFAISVSLSVPAVIKDATSDSDQKTPTVVCIQNF